MKIDKCVLCGLELGKYHNFHPICQEHYDKLNEFLQTTGKETHQRKIMYRILDFFRFLTTNYPGIISIWELSSKDYESYFKVLNSKEISANIKSRYHNNLFRYLKWLKRHENPQISIDLTDIFDEENFKFGDNGTQREETPIDNNEILDLLRYFKTTMYEDFILYSLLLCSGMRIGAAMSITLDKIDFKNRKISTSDKSTKHFGKNDYIISTKFATTLEAYIIELQRLYPNQSKLFRLTDKTYRKHLKDWADDYKKRTKIEINIHPHLFRDALNTILKERGMQDEDRCLILCQMAKGVNQQAYLKKYRNIKFRRELYDKFSPF